MDSLYNPVTQEESGLYKIPVQGTADLPSLWRSQHFPVLYNRGCRKHIQTAQIWSQDIHGSADSVAPLLRTCV